MQLVSTKICLFLIFLWPLTNMGQQKCEITFFLIGDSTLADKPYTGSNPEKGWGQVLPLFFKSGIVIENHAVNGRSSKSFREEGRWAIINEKLKPGDYVLIQFGHNDQKKESTQRYAQADTDYRSNLVRYIKETREKGAKPIIATPISRRSFDEKGNLENSHGRYGEVVKEVALEHNVPLLELQKLTMKVIEQFGFEKSKELFLHYQTGHYEKFPEGIEDNTHLSPTGAFKVADLAIKELKKVVPELAIFLKE